MDFDKRNLPEKSKQTIFEVNILTPCLKLGNINISQKRNKICIFVVVAIVFQKVNGNLVAD